MADQFVSSLLDLTQALTDANVRLQSRPLRLLEATSSDGSSCSSHQLMLAVLAANFASVEREAATVCLLCSLMEPDGT